MSQRSPHVNVRITRWSHDQLTAMTLKLSAVVGRRLSHGDVLDAMTVISQQHIEECAEMLQISGSDKHTATDHAATAQPIRFRTGDDDFSHHSDIC